MAKKIERLADSYAEDNRFVEHDIRHAYSTGYLDGLNAAVELAKKNCDEMCHGRPCCCDPDWILELAEAEDEKT